MVIQTNKIDTTSWEKYKLLDLGFTNFHGTRIKKTDRMSGNTIFLTAGKENLGIIGTIGNNITIWNCPITIDMFGNCFYHNYACSGDDNIYAFVNNNLSVYVKQYIASCINATTSNKYSYKEQFRQTDADKLEVWLPSINKNPDWAYMEQYVKAIEEKVEKTLNELEIAKDLENKKIDVTTWGEFRVGDLFELVRGKCSKTTGLLDGNIPYVGCTNINNGVMAFYDVEQNKISQGNCICFIGNGNGSAGEQIYRKEKFLCSSGNVCGYMNNLTPNIAHFIVSVMDAQQNATKEFSHANGRTLKKLSQQIIKLPIDANGHPDWNYMEQYMKTIENKTEKLINDLKLLYN